MSPLPTEIQEQLAEQRIARPVPEAMAEVEAAAAKINTLIDEWRTAGQITINLDLFNCPNIFTFRIQLPK